MSNNIGICFYFYKYFLLYSIFFNRKRTSSLKELFCVLKLIEPVAQYMNHFIDIMKAWKEAFESPFPWVLKFDYSDFKKMIKKMLDLSKGIGVPEDHVPSNIYWGYDTETDKLVGAVEIRHFLNKELYNTWGYIGYGVRPDERNKGYGTEILKLAIEKCADFLQENPLVGCYKDNLVCGRSIIKNGGVLESEHVEFKTGRVIKRFLVPNKV